MAWFEKVMDIKSREDILNIKIPEFKADIYKQIKEKWNALAKPLDGLGLFEDAICSVGAVQETVSPETCPRAIIIMCADNGIVAESISQSGQEVTLAVAGNMGRHMSPVCQMAHYAHAEIIAVDIGINTEEKIIGVLDRKVAKGTRNFLKEPAMTEDELVKAIRTGIELAGECKRKGIRLLATGEMGIGNTTTSAAVASAILGISISEATGRGAGLDDKRFLKKQEVIRQGIVKYGFDINDKELTFDVLMCLGGLDIAGLCGVFIGGALYHIPVIADGLISTVAALCAARLVPGCERFMLASHLGEEPAMKHIVKELGFTPVIHGKLKLGEGTGAVMMFPLLDMAAQVYNSSGSFDEIGVGQYKKLY